MRQTGLFLACMLAMLPAPSGAQCADGSVPPCRGAAPTNSVAVLYFDNLSRDSADLYLADGLTEELISRLSQVERIRVKSRTAVRALRGQTNTDPAVLGRMLGVSQLVSGSVLRVGGRIRINIELTRVATGNSVWGRSFDRSAGDVIKAQAEVAESIAVRLGGTLARAEQMRIQSSPTRNAAAYDHFLRGRFEAARRTTPSLLTAVREFEVALQLDSMMTSALVWLGQTYAQLGATYYQPEIGIGRDSVQALGRAALRRAILRDSTSTEVLLARTTGQDPVNARPWAERAVSQDPLNADAHHTLALVLRTFGEDSAAVAQWRRAVELEPDMAIAVFSLGHQHLAMRRYREAKPWLDSAVALRPDAPFYYLNHALVRVHLGDTAGARLAAEAVARRGSREGREEILARIEARAGDSSQARRRAESVEASMRGVDCWRNHSCLDLSATLAQVGLREKALDVLERISPRNSWFIFWTGREDFDAVRQDPRFQRLMQEARAWRVPPPNP